MRPMLVGLVGLALATPAQTQEVVEPGSGLAFAARSGDMALLGASLRTRTMFKVKVYAVGLYVSDAALSGPLAAHKGRPTGPAFYSDLVWGDFHKQIILKFVRDVTTDQIRGAFRDSLAGADKSKIEAFVGCFGDTKAGQEYVLRWTPPGTLETTVAGQARPPIADKGFAAAVFGIWLGPRPIQEDIKKALVSRAAELIR